MGGNNIMNDDVLKKLAEKHETSLSYVRKCYNRLIEFDCVVENEIELCYECIDELLSSRESESRRLKSWNTYPKLSLLKVAISLSLMVDTLFPAKITEPDEALSIAAKMLSKVVLPEPDSPMMATYSPSSTEKNTPLSASTLFVPIRLV